MLTGIFTVFESVTVNHVFHVEIDFLKIKHNFFIIHLLHYNKPTKEHQTYLNRKRDPAMFSTVLTV